MANFVICRDHFAMTISQQTLRKERSLSVYFKTYFMVIPTKTYTSLLSTSSLVIWDKTATKKHWSHPKIVRNKIETTFRHIFPPSELQCLPCSDPRNLCANARIRSLTTHLLHSSKTQVNHEHKKAQRLWTPEDFFCDVFLKGFLNRIMRNV